MSDYQDEAVKAEKKILIHFNGMIEVFGDIPLVRKTQVVSEFGEPLTWKKEGVIPTPGGSYCLCRCGASVEFPFCDGTHSEIDFDGFESADTRPIAARQAVLPGEKITVRFDSSVCSESGYCGFRDKNIEQLLPESGDTHIRALIMAMIERCPSGSYTYSIGPDDPEIEPDLPMEVALVTEIVSTGPVTGPWWVTGGIPIFRSDGLQYEVRNRVTLCSCGRSKNKPFCDGAHRSPEK